MGIIYQLLSVYTYQLLLLAVPPNATDVAPKVV